MRAVTALSTAAAAAACGYRGAALGIVAGTAASLVGLDAVLTRVPAAAPPAGWPGTLLWVGDVALFAVTTTYTPWAVGLMALGAALAGVLIVMGLLELRASYARLAVLEQR